MAMRRELYSVTLLLIDKGEYSMKTIFTSPRPNLWRAHRLTSRLSMLAAIAGVGCGGSSTDTSEPLQDQHDPIVFANNLNPWTNDGSPIPVCWAVPGWDQNKRWVQSAV